eukprot:2870667-Rhodomonas_salina.2
MHPRAEAQRAAAAVEAVEACEGQRPRPHRRRAAPRRRRSAVLLSLCKRPNNARARSLRAEMHLLSLKTLKSECVSTAPARLEASTAAHPSGPKQMGRRMADCPVAANTEMVQIAKYAGRFQRLGGSGNRRVRWRRVRGG